MDAAATNIAADGPRTIAAKSVGIKEIDSSMYRFSLTLPRSARAAARARMTRTHTFPEGAALECKRNRNGYSGNRE